jgi:hypothetical protein
MDEILQNKIGQLTAKRDYAAKMLEHGRATKAELAQAEFNLNQFLSNLSPYNKPSTPINIAQKPINQPVAIPSPPSIPAHIQALNTDFKTVQHQLLMSHKQLRNRQAELGNILAFIPKHETAIDLCQEIISIQKKIEVVWDQYRFIQHNGRLPDMALDMPQQELSESEIAKLNETKIALSRLYDKRGKLKAKIKNPSQHAKSFKALQEKPAEWATELLFTEKEIQRLELIRNELDIL